MLRRAALLAVVIAGLSACTARTAASGPTTPGGGAMIPGVVQQPGSGPWLSFDYDDGGFLIPGGITPGWDGATWFCNISVGRIAMDGTVNSYPLPSGILCNEQLGSANPVTRNPDGNVYFAWYNGQFPNAAGIGQITPSGTMTLFTAVTGSPTNVKSLTTGSDGNLWAVGSFGIWRMTTSGSFTIFPPTQAFAEVARGPDKNLWAIVSQASGAGVYRISIADGTVTQFTSSRTWGIVGGSDGNLWFGTGRTMNAMNPVSGVITTYPISSSVQPLNMVEGAHQILYFIDTRHSPAVLGRFSMRTHKLMKTTQLPGSDFHSLALGPDGNIWILEKSRPQIDVYVVDVITPTPAAVAVGVGLSTQLVATEKGFTNSLSATTSDPTIATVTQTGPDQFSVTGVATGSCAIALSDTKGNSEDVPVTVN